MPGDLERASWQFPEPGGKINLARLGGIIEKFRGQPSEVIKIKSNEFYTVYGFKNQGGFQIKVAYRCHNCENSFLGPPEITDDTSIEDGFPLAGREGYDLYCNGCGAHLDEFTIARS